MLRTFGPGSRLASRAWRWASIGNNREHVHLSILARLALFVERLRNMGKAKHRKVLGKELWRESPPSIPNLVLCRRQEFADRLLAKTLMKRFCDDYRVSDPSGTVLKYFDGILCVKQN